MNGLFKWYTKNREAIHEFRRWFVMAAVIYLILFNQRETVTQFHEMTERDSTIIVIDQKIIQREKQYQQVKQQRHEVYRHIDSIPDDSLRQHIVRAIQKR